MPVQVHLACLLATLLRRLYTPRSGINFPRRSASLFSWRKSSRFPLLFSHAATNLRPLSMAVSFHNPAAHFIAFQSPTRCQTPEHRSPRNRSTYIYLLHTRPPSTTPSTCPTTISFCNRSPIRMSVPALKGILAGIVVRVLSHVVILRVRSQEIIRRTGLLRCGPMIWRKARWCIEAYSHSFLISVSALKGILAGTFVRRMLSHTVIASARSQETIRRTDLLRYDPIL